MPGELNHHLIYKRVSVSGHLEKHSLCNWTINSVDIM